MTHEPSSPSVPDRPAPDHPAPIPFDKSWQYEVTVPCDPRGPAVVRATLRTVLVAHELGELLARAELLTSELATNSVRHTRGPAAVRMQWRHPVLRVSVWDPCPDLPKPAGCSGEPDPLADGGRGLLLLEAMADRWGGCTVGPGPFGPGGKTIWFELCLDSEPPSVALAA